MECHKGFDHCSDVGATSQPTPGFAAKLSSEKILLELDGRVIPPNGDYNKLFIRIPLFMQL